MANTTLTDEEAEVLRGVRGILVIKRRTREVGIKHGMDRFVSTNRTLDKHTHHVLDSVARKLGLESGIPIFNKD